MRILIEGIAIPRTGGIYVAETPFQQALVEELHHEVMLVNYGSKADGESIFRKLIDRAKDVIKFPGTVRKFKPDIIHFNSIYDRRALARDVCFVPLSRLLGQKVFLKYHGTDVALIRQGNWFWNKLGRITIGCANKIGVLSNEQRSYFTEMGYGGSKFVVVPNAVASFDLPGERMRQPSEIILLFIARFVPSKGLLDVIGACKILNEKGIAFKLFAVGDGPERGRAEEEVRKNGFSDRVVFTGHVVESEAKSYYPRADILVFPTRAEGFSMTLFQSLSAGTPVLTTKLRAAADYLEDGKTVLFIEPGNPAMIAEKVIRLANDRELWASLSRNARSLVQRFTPVEVSKLFVSLYEEVLAAE
jgi:glycosyltransferase involved in cell wall biosynthesis